MSNEPLAAFPIFEVIAYLVLYLSVASAWQSAGKGEIPAGETAEERSLGATVIMGQLNAVITGASIIIAGIAAFVALEKQIIGSPEKYHLLYATGWAVLSLCFSMYTLSALPTVAPKYNFVRLKGVALLCSTALFLCLAAGVRFLFAVWGILF